MGHAILPEWTVNMLYLGKEPWKFRDLDDQLNVYRQQWQADQKKQIILPKWLANIKTSRMTEREKEVIRIITISMAVAVVIAMETLLAEDAKDVEEAAAVAEEETIVSICKVLNDLIVARKSTIRLIVPSRKRTIKVQTWFRKMISKTCFKLQ
jgi:hypothetical protein